ncbi:MAG: Sporulation-specific N-acetylmuramoyl-L-alanine amidase [Firmicutes bacterium ADurb.Bin193]|nr:MAG: Sporulation-specific N-acetylmuramoyl-L-alanine amidase [Firmicutes bacterium ADurb.Bin193]
MNMKIFIDAGHGGKDSGASNAGLIEKNMTLITAKSAAEYLRKYGCEVKLSRVNDIYLSLTQRAKMANNWGADIFVSCHYNAGGGDRGETIHSVTYGKGTLLAGAIGNALKAFGQSVIKQYSKLATSGKGDYYTVISATNMPAVIVEPCFIDNEEDIKIADTEDEQAQVGVAIAKGILTFAGIPSDEEVISVSEQIINTICSRTGKSVDEVVEALAVLVGMVNVNEEDWEKEGVQHLMNAGLLNTMRDGREPVEMGKLGLILKRLEEKIKG